MARPSRSEMPAGPHQACRRRYTVWLAVLILALLFAGAPGARADQAGKAEDTAIDATIAALAESGLLPIPAEELRALSPMLKCMVHGDNEVLDCAKQAVYERLLGKDLAAAGPLVECLVGGKPVVLCAKNAAASQLPPEFKSIVECGSDLGGCVTKLATAQLPPEAQGIANCIASKKNVADCASQEAIKQLPPEAQAAAQCLAKGTDPKICAQNEVIAHLPDAAKPVAECIAKGGDPAKCAETQLISQLPGGTAQDVANCIKNGGNPVDCAAQQATGAAKEQYEAIKELSDPDKVPTILAMFKAIQEEDWATVAALGGVQAAKVASCVIIDIFVPIPGAQGLLCDYAGELIERRVQSAQIFVKQATAGDFGGMLGTLGKAGLIDQQCALAHVISSDIDEAICGPLAKAIDAGANSPVVVGILASMFTANPVIGTVVGAIWSLLTDKDECMKPEQWFANNFLICQHRDVYLSMTDPQQLATLLDTRTRECIKHYSQDYNCVDEDDAAKLCRALASESARETQALAKAYQVLAEARAQSTKPELEADRSHICASPTSAGRFTEAKSGFVASCSTMLNDVRPLKNLATSCTAGFDPSKGQVSFGGGPSAQQQACENAAQSSLAKVVSEVCAGAGVCFPVHPCDPEKEICGVDVK